jgi:type I restriction enzyme, S subunit
MVRIAPLKRFVDPARPITYGIVQAGEDVADGVPYIRPIDMNGHQGVHDVSRLRRTAPEIAQSYSRSSICFSDLVVSIGPSYGKTMIVPKELEGANLTQGTARVAPSPSGVGRYLRWALQSKMANDYWDAAVGGATFRALNLEPLAMTPIPVWSTSQQVAIADYLDAETARMDALIAKKRKMLDLVDEAFRVRQIQFLKGGHHSERVSHPVLGDLPSHWRAMRVKHCTSAATVGVVVNPSSYFCDTGVPFIHATDVREGWIDQSHLKRLSSESNDLLAKSKLRSGDVIAMRVGCPGRAAVVPAELDGANCASVLIFRPCAMLSAEILAEFLNSRLGRAQIAAVQYGAAQEVMNVSDAVNLVLPVPPPSEQQVVVRLLREASERVRVTTRMVLRQIDLLVEHRQALITAAVSGALQVPGAAT